MHFTDFDTRLAAYAVVADAEGRILLTWFRGSDLSPAGWSLPGGGVEFDESIEDAVIREVREETGYDVTLGPPLATDSWTASDTPRPYKSVRILYSARIVGGTLGTLEVEGSTERAGWVPIGDVAEPRARIVDLALELISSQPAAARTRSAPPGGRSPR